MIRQIIAKDQNLITYRPALRSIGGSVAGTVLLQQIMYWDDKKGGKFYKFATAPANPSKQPLYHAGDSWEEELGMSAKELRTALDKFAFKCGAKNKAKWGEEYATKRSEAVVQYYTDSNRITWYLLNRDLLSKLLLGIYKEIDDTEVTNTETNTETTTDITTYVETIASSCVAEVESSNKSPSPAKKPVRKNVPPPLDIQVIVAHYNESGMPKIVKLTDSRKGHLRARVKEYSEDEVIGVIDAAKRSRFLMGDNNRSWKADFDWLMNPTNFTKVVEGKYDDANGVTSQIQTF